jgi:hypothetical protein
MKTIQESITEMLVNLLVKGYSLLSPTARLMVLTRIWYDYGNEGFDTPKPKKKK